MASTFAGLNLFNSGPHRFIVGTLGRLTRGPYVHPNVTSRTQDFDVRELTLFQTGRLIAASEAALWSLVDAIKVQAELPRTGTLVDHHARSWTNLTLVRFAPDDRVDRGRTFSLRYEALYIRF